MSDLAHKKDKKHITFLGKQVGSSWKNNK